VHILQSHNLLCYAKTLRSQPVYDLNEMMNKDKADITDELIHQISNVAVVKSSQSRPHVKHWKGTVMHKSTPYHWSVGWTAKLSVVNFRFCKHFIWTGQGHVDESNHSNYRCIKDPAVTGWDIYTIDRWFKMCIWNEFGALNIYWNMSCIMEELVHEKSTLYLLSFRYSWLHDCWELEHIFLWQWPQK